MWWVFYDIARLSLVLYKLRLAIPLNLLGHSDLYARMAFLPYGLLTGPVWKWLCWSWAQRSSWKKLPVRATVTEQWSLVSAVGRWTMGGCSGLHHSATPTAAAFFFFLANYSHCVSLFKCCVKSWGVGVGGLDFELDIMKLIELIRCLAGSKDPTPSYDVLVSGVPWLDQKGRSSLTGLALKRGKQVILVLLADLFFIP